MVSASPPCAAPNSISAFAAPKTENQVPGGGLCPLRRISTRRSTRQDAQINYLSTLSIFMKQTTYLATLPNQVRKLGKSHRIVAMATSHPGGRSASGPRPQPLHLGQPVYPIASPCPLCPPVHLYSRSGSFFLYKTRTPLSTPGELPIPKRTQKYRIL